MKWQKEREWYELPCTSAFTKVYWAPCIVHNSVSQPAVVCCNGIVIESNVLWGGIIRPYNMHEHSVMPHNAVFGEMSFRAIPGYVPPEPKSKRNTIFMDDKNAYFIPDNIETIPEVEDVLSDLLGQEVWIPYDLTERKKKFPWFFDPNDRRFKYVQRACNEECTYDLNTIAPFPSLPNESSSVSSAGKSASGG